MGISKSFLKAVQRSPFLTLQQDVCKASLYTVYGKTFEGENFRGFLANRESFPLESLLCTVHNGMGLMHRESFPVNGVFCAQLRKFSPSKVLPYTVTWDSYICTFSKSLFYSELNGVIFNFVGQRNHKLWPYN